MNVGGTIEMKYFFKKIEPKWQAKWEESKVFEAKDNSDKPKFYGLVEFPPRTMQSRQEHTHVSSQMRTSRNSPTS